MVTWSVRWLTVNTRFFFLHLNDGPKVSEGHRWLKPKLKRDWWTCQACFLGSRSAALISYHYLPPLTYDKWLHSKNFVGNPKQSSSFFRSSVKALFTYWRTHLGCNDPTFGAKLTQNVFCREVEVKWAVFFAVKLSELGFSIRFLVLCASRVNVWAPRYYYPGRWRPSRVLAFFSLMKTAAIWRHFSDPSKIKNETVAKRKCIFCYHSRTWSTFFYFSSP